MSNDSIYVGSFEEMNAAADNLHKFSEEYQRISDQLMNVAQTMGDAWSGEDNLRFVEQISGCKDNLAAMAEHLEKASTTLRQQNENYSNKMEANKVAVSKLAN